eukprot:m.74959 g.74959  ORF g.74959 m.74959 type:complete len:708 (-) comp11828_c0_seq5:48-2171(-)
MVVLWLWLCVVSFGFWCVAATGDDDVSVGDQDDIRNNDAIQQIIQMYNMGQQEFEMGNLDNAAFIFKKLVKAVPEFSAGYIGLGVVYEKQKDFGAAFETFSKARRKFPKDFDVAMALCRFGASILNSRVSNDHLKSTATIVKACKSASKINPSDVEAMAMYGNLLVLLMRFEEASPILEKTVKFSEGSSTHFQNMMNLVLCNLRGGMIDHVIDNLNAIQRAHPNDPAIHHLIGSTRSIIFANDRKSIDELVHGLNIDTNKYNLRDPVFCPSGKWKLVMNWTDAASPNIETQLLNPLSASTIYKSSEPVRIFPATTVMDPYFTEYAERYLFMVNFKNKASMWKREGLLSSPCTFYSASQMWNVEIDKDRGDQRFMKTVKVTGRVASTLPLKNLGNYYHWMVEGLIRVAYYQDLFFDDPEYSDVKLLIPTANKQGFVQESLKLLGIDKSRLLPYTAEDNERWLFKDDFYLMDWISPKDEPVGSLQNDAWSPFYPPKEGLEKLRSKLHQALSKHSPGYDSDTKKIVFVSRTAGKSVRSIINEDHVLNGLVAEFGKRNVLIHTGKESLTKQLLMFAKAKAVVGAHGAGLANLVMCTPGTPLVMFPMEPHVDRSFGHLATALDLPQWIVSNVTSYYYGNYGVVSQAQIETIVTSVGMALGAIPLDENKVSVGTRKAATKAEVSITQKVQRGRGRKRKRRRKRGRRIKSREEL